MPKAPITPIMKPAVAKPTVAQAISDKAAAKALKKKFKADGKVKDDKKDKGAAASVVPLSLSERIEADDVFVRTINKVNNLLKVVNIEHIIDELFQKHAARTIRTMTVKKLLSDQQTQLLETNMQNQAYRSRIVELQLQNYRISASVADSLSKLKKYLTAAYSVTLKEEGYTTIGDRANYIDGLVAEYSSRVAELDVVWTICEKLVADFDSAGYSMLRIQGILEMTTGDR